LPGKKIHMSALKAVRRDARKTVYRGTVRASTRTNVKRARTLIASAKMPATTEAAVQAAISALDKAAQKGIIHKNQAARRKSRLMAALHKTRAVA